MPLFYTPHHARVGDVIPFFDEGKFKPFYLKNWNPYHGMDRTDGWHMLETEDHLSFTEHPTGILGGTGSVLQVDGLYHMFYCKFENNPQRQYVWHATSGDLRSWKEHPGETFGPDEKIYQLTDWRDPFVFWNDEERKWWMLLSAKNQGVTSRTGCIGLCTSEDLRHWTCEPPVYAPEVSIGAYECPDLFQIDHWYYLVFSQFTDDFFTRYRMSRSLRGPWITPKVDSFDARAFYAAKSGTDGTHRYLYGWNPTRVNNTWRFNPQKFEGYDYNTYDWGGTMVVHEVVQQADGTLRVKPPDSVNWALSTPNRLFWKPILGKWSTSWHSAQVDSPYGYACMLSENDVPNTCKLEMDVTFAPGTKTFGIALQVDKNFDRGYYFYFEPEMQRLQYKGPLRMHEQGGWTFPHDVELERPVELIPERRYKLRVFVEGSVVVLYVNDSVALSARCHDLHDRKFGLIVSNGCATFEGIRLFTE